MKERIIMKSKNEIARDLAKAHHRLEPERDPDPTDVHAVEESFSGPDDPVERAERLTRLGEEVRKVAVPLHLGPPVGEEEVVRRKHGEISNFKLQRERLFGIWSSRFGVSHYGFGPVATTSGATLSLNCSKFLTNDAASSLAFAS